MRPELLEVVKDIRQYATSKEEMTALIGKAFGDVPPYEMCAMGIPAVQALRKEFGRKEYTKEEGAAFLKGNLSGDKERHVVGVWASVIVLIANELWMGYEPTVSPQTHQSKDSFSA